MLYNTILVVVGLGLVGCAPVSYVYHKDQLPCPPHPDLPIVLESELSVLDDYTYYRLVNRELALREHITLLEVYCE